MSLQFVALYEIYWYGFWWLPFIAIAYGVTRCLGWPGIIASIVIVSMMILFIDVHWIFKDMNEHPENGRDADAIFWFGVFCRITFFNIVLVPASIVGWMFRARSRRRLPPASFVNV